MIFSKYKIAFFLFLPFILIGCDKEIHEPTYSLSFELETPDALVRNDTSANRTILQVSDVSPPIVTFNGNPAVIELEGDAYTASAEFTGNSVEVSINWQTIDDSGTLPLASFQDTFVLEDGASFLISAEDYDISADSDSDLDPNIRERFELLTDPRNSNLCSRCRTDVDTHINVVPLSPEVDGFFEPLWNSSQFKDRFGDLVLEPTDNFDVEGNFVDFYPEDPNYRFSIMTDNSALYLMFYTERLNFATPDEFDQLSIGIGPIAVGSVNGQNEFDFLDLNFLDETGTNTSFFNSNVFQFATSSVTSNGGRESLWEVRLPFDNGSESLARNLNSDRFILEITLFDAGISAVPQGQFDPEFSWSGIVSIRDF